MERGVETILDFVAGPRDFSGHVIRQNKGLLTYFQGESHPFIFQGEAAPFGGS